VVTVIRGSVLEQNLKTVKEYPTPFNVIRVGPPDENLKLR